MLHDVTLLATFGAFQDVEVERIREELRYADLRELTMSPPSMSEDLLKVILEEGYYLFSTRSEAMRLLIWGVASSVVGGYTLPIELHEYANYLKGQFLSPEHKQYIGTLLVNSQQEIHLEGILERVNTLLQK